MIVGVYRGATNNAFELELDISSRRGSYEVTNSSLGMITPLTSKNNVTSLDIAPSIVAAVQVSNVTKSYGPNNVILNDFSMTVDSGTIFALLGASGCGKTTLMSCIVGLKDFTSGSIMVYGAEPGTYSSGIPGPSIGYMPQETALLEDFTIAETLQYFGRVLEMTGSKIKERTEFLLEFLKLPPKDRFVKNLSGGQQRRVSFAVALLHSPKLLILDEPTVGVDPLLRESIWDHLKQLVQTEGTTIIITTHYIGEARDADKVGLMRNGRLLAQDSPENVLREHECDTLDQVVLKLCLQDTVRGVLDNGGDEIKPLRQASTTLQHSTSQKLQKQNEYPPMKKRIRTSCNRLQALVVKNFISLWRQILFVFTLLFLPAIQLIICCYAVGRDPSGLVMGVVNNEVPFVRGGDESCFVDEDCPTSNISCLYIEKFQTHESYRLKFYESDEDASKAVERGETWGYFTFGANFSSEYLDRQSAGPYAETRTIDESLIKVHLDMSSYLVAASLQKALFEAFNKFNEELLVRCLRDPYAAQSVIAVQKPIYGSKGAEFTEFMAPGTLLSLILFMAISLTGVVYITEKKSGIMERSLVCGVTPFEIILSHVISQYSIMVIQAGLALTILVTVFKVTIYGSFGGVILLVILQGTLGMFFGFFLSTTCKDEKTVLQMTQTVTMPLFVLSGVIWPTESMPTVMKYISSVMPQTYASESMRSMVNRGWPLFHPTVWPGFAVTIAWIALFWTLTIVFARRR